MCFYYVYMFVYLFIEETCLYRHPFFLNKFFLKQLFFNKNLFQNNS